MDNHSMNIGVYLHEATKKLAGAGVETARLDVLILLEDVLHRNRASLLAHPQTLLSDGQLATMNNFITQRQKHVPLAYIRGKAMFYGREFAVDSHVLVPRPETETIIEMLKQTPLGNAPCIADIGTGSGCIGITAGLELPGSQIFLYDIDPHTLALARKNAQTYNLTIQVAEQDLLAGSTQHFDIILANLPYVPENFAINQAAKHEPKLALFSGADGLDHYRRFWAQLSGLSAKPRYVIIESMPDQHKVNTALARGAGYAPDQAKDFIQRFVLLTATEE